jgi:site-specific recombinase XerD
LKARHHLSESFQRALRQTPPAEITRADIRTLRSKRLQTSTQYGRQRSVTNVYRELNYLRRIFNIAEREGFINKNPFRSGDTRVGAFARG